MKWCLAPARKKALPRVEPVEAQEEVRLGTDRDLVKLVLLLNELRLKIADSTGLANLVRHVADYLAAGTSQTTPSGGRSTGAEKRWLCHGTASASTPA